MSFTAPVRLSLPEESSNLKTTGKLNIIDEDAYTIEVQWEISNFMYYYNKCRKILKSDTFSMKSECCNVWRLFCLPRGTMGDPQDFVSVYLHATSRSGVNFELSILGKDPDRHEKHNNGKKHTFLKGRTHGFRKLAMAADLFNDPDNFMPKGALTICCVISFNCNCDETKAEELKNDLQKILFNEDTSDIVIQVDDVNIPAHSAILAARSPVFMAMFSHKMSETLERKIVITDIREDIIKEMLKFIYTGTITSPCKLPEELLYAADKYQLDGLKEHCKKLISEDITKENALRRFLFSDEHDLRLAKSRSFAVLLTNIDSVAKTDDFERIMASHPDIVKKLLLNIKSHRHSISNYSQFNCPFLKKFYQLKDTFLNHRAYLILAIPISFAFLIAKEKCSKF